MADTGTYLMVGLAFLGAGVVIGILLPKKAQASTGTEYEPIDTTTYVCDL
jgi:F0F1-type ATP synthase membrane subunit c/vacuolar-type H+-ATPase subunit K